MAHGCPPGHLRVRRWVPERDGDWGQGAGGRRAAGVRSGTGRKERWREGRRSSGGRRGPARGGERRAERSWGKREPKGTQGGEAPREWQKAGPAPTWHRHTISDSVASRSTTLPLPSSPHCAPSTTVTLLPPGSLRARFSPPAAGWPLRSLDARVPDMLGGWVAGRVAVAEAAAASRFPAAAEPCALPAPRRRRRHLRAPPPAPRRADVRGRCPPASAARPPARPRSHARSRHGQTQRHTDRDALAAPLTLTVPSHKRRTPYCLTDTVPLLTYSRSTPHKHGPLTFRVPLQAGTADRGCGTVRNAQPRGMHVMGTSEGCRPLSHSGRHMSLR